MGHEERRGGWGQHMLWCESKLKQKKLNNSGKAATKIMAKIILLWVLKKHFALRDEIFDN